MILTKYVYIGDHFNDNYKGRYYRLNCWAAVTDPQSASDIVSLIAEDKSNLGWFCLMLKSTGWRYTHDPHRKDPGNEA